MSGQMTRQKANSLMARIMSLVDRVAPPETRRELVNNCYNLANDRPLLATFLAIQIILSALPFLLFVSFTLATIVLAVVAALAFCIFWIGAALMIFIPTLFATIFAAIFIWIWAVGTYIFGRFAYRKVYPRLQQSAASRKSLPGTIGGGSGSRRSAGAANGTMSSSNNTAAPGVPELVKRSLNEAHESPEAAANKEAVDDKKAFEHELLDEVKSENPSGGEYSRTNGKVNATSAQKADIDGTWPKMDGSQQASRRLMPGQPKF